MTTVVYQNQATASKRRQYYHLVDATDGMTPETGEAGGQPQVSVNGAAWTNAGTGVLVHIGNGRYYSQLEQSLVTTTGDYIEGRYKSANTAECPAAPVQVEPFPASGAGSESVEYVEYQADGVTPLGDVDVWFTSDAAGVYVVASGRTHSITGVITVKLDAGTYYVWRQKAGWNPSNPVNPKTITVADL